AKQASRFGLSLFSKQSNGCRGIARATFALGGLRSRTRRASAVRRRIRGLHFRSPNSAFHFRDSRRARVRYGIPQFFEKRGIHRCALWLYGDAEKSARPNGRRPSAPAASTVAAAVEHEVKQCVLPSAAGCRSIVFR